MRLRRLVRGVGGGGIVVGVRVVWLSIANAGGRVVVNGGNWGKRWFCNLIMILP